MTAGLSYNINSPQIQKCREETDGRCPTRELMKYLAQEPLIFEPGERWEYSLCHDVLAALIEVITGKRFGEFVKEKIFKPLGMENSTFRTDDECLERVCPHYRYDPETKEPKLRSKTVDYKLGSEYESGGAGCVSTVEDYMRFLEALRTEKLISGKTIDLMTTDYIKEDQKQHFWLADYGYGLGVRCPMAGDRERSDFGWGGAAGAYLFIDRENEISAFYAQHVLGSPVQTMRQQITPVITRIIKENR